MPENMSQMAADLNTIAQGIGEIGAGIDTLEAELADVETTPEVDAALQAVKDSVASVTAKLPVLVSASSQPAQPNNQPIVPPTTGSTP